ncbi:hypothetical protein CCICO_04245 [Corynebacterium ciconiae DSM 44920]|uniref:hypothetical protein n=1 Tax=Corynebacterium ciconiae TaxID=227319 RepID=UPI000366BE97|nr:hypothetical protein [Corynebacterium ciconiae]WKD60886.1 hypothetical protein CCICO_04245 [Corynebacterium ciconiae DSM 44920]
MDLAILFAGIGTFTGIVGLLYAQLAHRSAKDANRIAERALTEAEESNRIAVQANKLAEDSNTIANRAILMTSEDFEYQWRLHVNQDGTMWISHDGTHDALDLTLFVEAKRSGNAIAPLSAYHRHENEVSPGAQLFFDVQSIFPELTSKARSQRREIIAMFEDSAIYGSRNPVKFTVVANLKFKTPGGRQLGNVLEHRISCRENQAGIIEFTQID